MRLDLYLPTVSDLISIIRLIISDKFTFNALKIAWVLVAFFSCLMLYPADDDFHFLQGALGFIGAGFPSMQIADQFIPIFTYLPGAFIFYGGFLWLQDFIGVPINIFTYRIFHFFTIIALIFSSLRMIRLIQEKRGTETFYAHGSLFMLFLALTPFGQFAWSIRPEPLGLLMLVLGLSEYILWDKNPTKVFHFLLGAIFFGLAIIIHPNFSIRAAPLIFVIMLFEFRRGGVLRAFLYGSVASLPFLFSALWFFTGYPFSWEEFHFSISWKKASPDISPPVIYMLNLAFMQSNWGSLAVDFVYAVFWLPLVFIVLAFLMLIVFRGKQLNYKDPFFILIFVLAILEVIRLLLPEADITLSYFNISSFVFVLAVTTMILDLNKFSTSSINTLSRPIRKVFTIFLIALVFLHSSIHGAKFFLLPNEYPLIYSMRNTVESNMRPGDMLFISPGTLVPVFADRLSKNYDAISGNEVLYRGDIFSPNLELIETSKKFFLKKLSEIPIEKIVWGILKDNSLVNDRPGVAKINITSFRGTILSLYFEIGEIIYEDKKNLFFRPIKMLPLDREIVSHINCCDDALLEFPQKVPLDDVLANLIGGS